MNYQLTVSFELLIAKINNYITTQLINQSINRRTAFSYSIKSVLTIELIECINIMQVHKQLNISPIRLWVFLHDFTQSFLCVSVIILQLNKDIYSGTINV
jgi:hypothetical protein